MNKRGGALGITSTVFTSVPQRPLSVCLCRETGGNDAKPFKTNNFEKISQKVPYDQGFDEGRDARQVPEAPEAHLPLAGMKF